MTTAHPSASAQRAADAKADKQLLAEAGRVPDINAEITKEGLLHLSFRSGNTVTIDPAKLSDSIRAQATLHGLKQKLVDAAAIARDTATGRSATPADKEAAVMEVFNRITHAEGTWNKVREAGATAVGGLLVAALMQMTGKDKASILDFLKNKTTEEKAALRKNPKVAHIIAELQAASANNSTVDTDALLGELMPEVAETVDDATGSHLAEEEAHAHSKRGSTKKATHAAAH